jgi:hypothetical protein
MATMCIRRLGTAAAAVLLLAGCSGSEDAPGGAAATSAAETGSSLAEEDAAGVVDAAFTALEDAGAVHVVGSVEEGGSTQELDLQLQGEDAQGTVTLDGTTAELVFTGGTAYVRAPADYWASFGMPAEFAGRLEGRWALMPAEVAGSFSTLTLSGMVDQRRAAAGAQATGEVTSDELDGEPVVVVTQADGSSLTVADDEAAPYPLRIDNEGDAPATVEFSEFGGTVEITAPEDPVDLDGLGG